MQMMFPFSECRAATYPLALTFPAGMPEMPMVPVHEWLVIHSTSPDLCRLQHAQPSLQGVCDARRTWLTWMAGT